MRVTLEVTEGPHKGQTFNFNSHDTFLVGRSKRAHLRLPAKDRYFSRVHFLVEVNPPHCRLMDMGSHNGTSVNGTKVEMVDLKDGDVIKAGHTVFRFHFSDEETDKKKGKKGDAKETALGGTEGTATQPGGVPPSITVPPPVTTKMAKDTIMPACPVGGSVANADCKVSLDRPLKPIDTSLCGECKEKMERCEQKVPGYRLLRELGRGGMGLVHLAARESDGQLFAVKTVTPTVEGTSSEVSRFLREAEVLRQVDHPHVVRFQEMSSANGKLWFAMDYVPGTDGRKLLKKQGPLALPRAVRLMSQMLEGLEYAHAKGFVHRDIKPGNVLVTLKDGQEVALLADFGLARVYQSSQLSGLTMTGALAGTPMFMPPEQITNCREARPPADQYAAAMTLYNLLTNNYAFEVPEQFREWVTLILEEDPIPVRKRRPELPAELDEILDRALQKDTEDRFPDVRSFRKALQQFLN